MAKKTTTCANCNRPISEGQPTISANSSIRTKDFFHADASGCSEAPSVTTIRKKAGTANGKRGPKPSNNGRGSLDG